MWVSRRAVVLRRTPRPMGKTQRGDATPISRPARCGSPLGIVFAHKHQRLQSSAKEPTVASRAHTVLNSHLQICNETRRAFAGCHVDASGRQEHRNRSVFGSGPAVSQCFSAFETRCSSCQICARDRFNRRRFAGLCHVGAGTNPLVISIFPQSPWNLRGRQPHQRFDSSWAERRGDEHLIL